MACAQNVSGYPPQPSNAYGPSGGAGAYSAPHTQQHAGPRSQYSNPYSAPGQTAGPAAQGAAPGSYGAAAQPSAYGLTGEAGGEAEADGGLVVHKGWVGGGGGSAGARMRGCRLAAVRNGLTDEAGAEG